MKLLKDPCYEIRSPIGDQEVPSQNVPDANSDDMTSIVSSQNFPDENSDDMIYLVPSHNIPGENSDEILVRFWSLVRTPLEEKKDDMK